MKIGIIGYGYVGKAMAALFETHYDVEIYDPGIKEYSDKSIVNACDVGVICVPTPMGENNECDTSLIWATMEWLECPTVLLKSTSAIGTTDALNAKYDDRVVFSPEFVGESTHYTAHKFTNDVKETPFFIFGGAREATNKWIDIFMPITGPSKIYRQTTAREAELTKYVVNSYLAMKVAFSYEMDMVCKSIGINYNEVRDLWLLDPRVTTSHTGVMETNFEPFGLPPPEGNSKCFPKDVNGIVQCARDHGYDPKLLAEVSSSNLRIGKLRRENKK
jgi:nucleotide sugar dehydrogenase